MDIKDFLKFLHKEGVLSENENGGYVFAYPWSPKKVYTEEEARDLVKGFHSLSSDEQEDFRFDNYDCSSFEAMIINAAIAEGSSPETSDYLEELIHKYLKSCNVSPGSLIHSATPEFYEDVIDDFWLHVGVDYNVAELFEKNGLSQYPFIQQIFNEKYEERKKELDILFKDSLETSSSYLEEMDSLERRIKNIEILNVDVQYIFSVMCEHIADPQMSNLIYDFLSDGWGHIDVGVNISHLPLFETNVPKEIAEKQFFEWKLIFLEHLEEKVVSHKLTIFFDASGVVNNIVRSEKSKFIDLEIY